MWDWVRWVGDQVWGAVASVIRTIEAFWNFIRENVAKFFAFLEKLFWQLYVYLKSVVVWLGAVDWVS